MKNLAIISIAILGIFAFYSAETISAQTNEIEAVKIPLENYLMGHKTGKAEFMDKAMYKEGKLTFIRDGKYTKIEFPDYMKLMKGDPAKDESERKRWIESIEITGTVAIGKLVFDYPHIKITDYMTLLKVEDEWKIVHKASYSELKEPTKNKK